MMFIAAISYLSIPVFIFLFSFFSTPFVILSSIALSVFIFYLCSSQLKEEKVFASMSSLARYWPLSFVSLLTACIFTGYQFDIHDWKNYYAAFNLMIQNPWTPVYELDGQTWFLRYYLAWFMPSALLGKIFGSQFLTATMIVWSAIGLYISMLLAFRSFHKTSSLLIAPLVLLFFSGLDLIGALLTSYAGLGYLHPYWLSWWAGYDLFAMLSFLDTFHHSPHHALAALIPTCLFLFNRRPAVQYGILIIVLTSMWSTFCAIGLLPIFTWALYKEGIKTSLTPQNFLVAPLLAIPIVLYLTQGTGHVPLMFVWEDKNFSFYNFLLFFVLESLLPLVFLYYLLKKDRDIIVILTIFLAVLCACKIGMINNLLYRGAMPAVCVMSIFMLKALLSNRGWRRESLIIYMCVAALPDVVAYAKRFNMATVDRSVSFQEHYDSRPSENRDTERWQYLVQVAYATCMFNVPLLRMEMSSKDNRKCE